MSACYRHGCSFLHAAHAGRLREKFLAIAPMRYEIFGYEVPMPPSDVYIALTTVAAFLPTVLVIHRLVAFIGRQLYNKRARVA